MIISLLELFILLLCGPNLQGTIGLHCTLKALTLTVSVPLPQDRSAIWEAPCENKISTCKVLKASRYINKYETSQFFCVSADNVGFWNFSNI
jgi:hypothetical protein